MDIKTTLDYLRSHASENELLEFKEAKTTYNFNKLGKYFSALSNEANLLGKDDAWLVFGIKDKDKKIVGTRFRTDTAKLQSLKAEIANKTTHRITFKEIHEINTGQGRVILFQIPPAPKGIPVAWAGHYYGREGEQLNALSLEELERIRKQGIENDWSIETCKHAAITDLSEQAILKARKLYGVKNPGLVEEVEQWDDITFLNKAKLCIKGKITRTAILLLGRPESEHFIHPGVAKISWILKDRDNIEKDYAHFSCPFLLSIEEVYKKIRNLKYRYLPDGSLFPDEVDSYDPYIIREALNNCIAHQDYTLGGKINVIENEDSLLIFVNMGSFIPQTIENVITADAPESQYRNSFLSNAMVNLNMIDTIGSGIKKMFTIQKKKFFPLPEYTLTNNQVKVVITGKVLDMNYAKKLAQIPKLSLNDIILLDKVQKHKPLEDTEIKKLRKNRLIEGRKPNFYISSQVARKTGQKADYMHLKGIDDNYCKKIIVDYLREFSEGKRADFEKILLDKLSGVLDEQQKKNKIKNYLQTLKKAGVINIIGKTWQMSKGK
ncbi:MAG: putative DNA binding domain-containing protein [Desulfobacula sp.]|uniref:RNA-binding domain-containing protein n=1 Tax=Desulfobacula sp. TaxID=2593537 RepID=UPI0025C224B8|nr:RNA-binding domain-containing protein [Desulfobacula sp.]MCD4719635.1 putative DNA binding domain-containing protein [Desulfobacula sp.]